MRHLVFWLLASSIEGAYRLSGAGTEEANGYYVCTSSALECASFARVTSGADEQLTLQATFSLGPDGTPRRVWRITRASGGRALYAALAGDGAEEQ